MILQALKEYYDRKAALPDSGIAPYGLEWKDIPYIVVLDNDGNPVNIEVTYEGEGKKRRAKQFLVPRSVKRASGIAANLLWDNPDYALGLNVDPDDKKVAQRHEAFVSRVAGLSGFSSPEITSLMKFLKAENKRQLLEQISSGTEVLAQLLEESKNVSFRIAGSSCIIPELEAVRIYAVSVSGEADAAILCLVTGKSGQLARMHSAIKGVWGAQTSGANIVSFNQDSFESYGNHKAQGKNAPVGKEAEFAYTTALNFLLRKDSTQRLQVGDASTVFWSDKENMLEPLFAPIFNIAPKDDPDANTNAVKAFLMAVHTGVFSAQDANKCNFYVLGLAPNASRISIRFWINKSVSVMAENIAEHFADIAIVHGPKEHDALPLFRLLVSTASLGKSENIPPKLAGDTMRAILEGLPYPRTLLQAAINRIRAEHEISYTRAALIKACLNRDARLKNQLNKEELKVSLDKENKSAGYLLGRLFATLERIQERANLGINATIRDRFYGSASGTPVVVFGNLMRLKNHHLAKLSTGERINFEKLLGEIHTGIDAKGYPAHLPLDEQGRFAIGYYHQKQDFYTAKEAK